MFLDFYLFYVFGERVIGSVREGGTKHFISFEGVLNIFRRFSGGAKFYGSILEYPPPPPPPPPPPSTHTL
jgi:hypothetical protein